jgi:hypothetical protein
MIQIEYNNPENYNPRPPCRRLLVMTGFEQRLKWALSSNSLYLTGGEHLILIPYGPHATANI